MLGQKALTELRMLNVILMGSEGSLQRREKIKVWLRLLSGQELEGSEAGKVRGSEKARPRWL